MFDKLLTAGAIVTPAIVGEVVSRDDIPLMELLLHHGIDLCQPEYDTLTTLAIGAPHMMDLLAIAGASPQCLDRADFTADNNPFETRLKLLTGQVVPPTMLNLPQWHPSWMRRRLRELDTDCYTSTGGVDPTDPAWIATVSPAEVDYCMAALSVPFFDQMDTQCALSAAIKRQAKLLEDWK